jgi:hypothetical protein
MVEMRVLHKVVSVLNCAGRLGWRPQILAATLPSLVDFLSTLLRSTPLEMPVLQGNMLFPIKNLL